MVLEKTLERPLDGKEIKPVNLKRNQSWIFIGRTDAKAEAPVLWPSDAKNWLTGKNPDAGKDWRQEEKGTTGWDGWMALLTQWTWVWTSSGSWWWTGTPGMLQSMGSQRVGHDWAPELKMATIKKMDNNKYWQGYEETGTLLHCWWIVKWYGRFGERFGLSSKKS